MENACTCFVLLSTIDIEFFPLYLHLYPYALSNGIRRTSVWGTTVFPGHLRSFRVFRSVYDATPSSGRAVSKRVCLSYPSAGSANYVPLRFGAMTAFFGEGDPSSISMDALFSDPASAVLLCQSSYEDQFQTRRTDDLARDWLAAPGRGLWEGRAAAHSNRV